MTIPLETLLGPVAALALALLIIYRFMEGKLLSRNVVPREDFDRVVAINESYAVRFGEQTEVVRDLAREFADFAKQKPAARRRKASDGG